MIKLLSILFLAIGTLMCTLVLPSDVKLDN